MQSHRSPWLCDQTNADYRSSGKGKGGSKPAIPEENQSRLNEVVQWDQRGGFAPRSKKK